MTRASAGILVSDLDLRDQYRSIFENAIEGIYQTTIDGRYLRVNPALARIYGYPSPDALMSALTDIAGQLYVDPTRRTAFQAAMAEEGFVQNFEAEIYRRDGQTIWISETARCVRGRLGEILYYEGMVEDVTARRASEQKLRLMATVFDSVADGILIVDRDLTVMAVNPAHEAISGFTREDMLGQPLGMLLEPGFHEQQFLPGIWATLQREGRWSGEATCRHKDGPPFVGALSMAQVRGGEGDFGHAVVTCSNISERKEQEQRIWHHANYDLLTQLPNRWLLTERLSQAILAARRHDTMLAVLFLDLNGFKQINDGMGHQAGDRLLQQVARRLQCSTRLSDIIGRLGGDEFLVVAPDLDSREAAVHFVDKILYSLGEPFQINGQQIFCQPSIGVACFPEDGDDAETLIRHSDLAMYEAKRDKQQRFVPYTPVMEARSNQQIAIESELRQAIERQDLVLHFQPKAAGDTRQLTGAEALVRWRHPMRGLVPPGEFIPIAEESGLILPLGGWVLREACRQFAEWLAQGLDLPRLSINLSLRQFRDADFLRTLHRVIEQTGLPATAIELELTESAMLVDIDATIAMLRSLKALGVRLAIDDFGTGYSSLAYLKRLPIDVVKIDRSFVCELAENRVDRKIVRAIVDLAGALGFVTVAEGVENEAQAAILGDMGCNELQGYLIGHPEPADRFEAMLAGRALVAAR